MAFVRWYWYVFKCCCGYLSYLKFHSLLGLFYFKYVDKYGYKRWDESYKEAFLRNCVIIGGVLWASLGVIANYKF